MMISQISGIYIDKYSCLPYYLNLSEGCEIIDISPSTNVNGDNYFDISYLDSQTNFNGNFRDYEIIIVPVYYNTNLDGYKFLNKFEIISDNYIDRFFVFIKKHLTPDEILLQERGQKIKKVLSNS